MSKKIDRMDGALLCAFLRYGADYLGQHKEEVNALNVFPVPDGDTGINMFLTVSSAVAKLPRDPEPFGVGKIAGDFAQGTLMGARGNSGVILSQIFRGFASSLSGKQTVNGVELAAAIQKGVDIAYKSVMKPVEGTILTVYREFAAAAVRTAAKKADIAEMLRQAIQAGAKALENTPNLLPVLKEAGVVDAGGHGLLCFMEGGRLGIANGKPIPFAEAAPEVPEPRPLAATVKVVPQESIAAEDIEFTYCTQLLIKGENLPIDRIRDRLSQDPPGDSLLVVGDENVIKIHFHNNHPGQVLEYCAQFGSLHDIIIDNMLDQHHQTIIDAAETAAVPAPSPPAAPAEPLAHCGAVAVCVGEGMSQIYQDLGAQVLSGGQTMNPSAEDLVQAVEQCPAEQVVILPNNSNIILTAGQVQYLTEKKVCIVASKYVTQGLTAMLRFNPEHDAEQNAAAMEKAGLKVLNGELTYAVRDTKYNGFSIKTGDILALMEGEIAACGEEVAQTLSALIAKMMAQADEPELLSLFYGHDLTGEQAEALAQQAAEQYPEVEVETHFGGQPLYYFLIAVE